MKFCGSYTKNYEFPPTFTGLGVYNFLEFGSSPVDNKLCCVVVDADEDPQIQNIQRITDYEELDVNDAYALLKSWEP